MRLAAGLAPLVLVLAFTSCSASSATPQPPPGADASSPDAAAPVDAAGDTAAFADAATIPDASAPTPDGSSADTGATTTPAADFEAQLAKLNCQFEARCGFIAAAEEAACEAAVDAQAGAPLPYDAAIAVADGRLHFDPTSAKTCLDLTKTKGCFDQLAPATACGAVYAGAVAIGGVCRANGECANARCDRGTTIHDGCAGACAAFTPTNAACGAGHAPCAASDCCDTATSHQCKPRSAKGATCDPNNGPYCQSGLFCVGTTCAPPGGGPGAPCASGLFGGSCAAGSYCSNAGTCAPRQKTSGPCASFDACDDGLDCVGIVFDPNTGALLTNGACGPYLDRGAACDPTLAESGCPGETTCDATTKKCVDVGTEGADCNTGSLYCRQELYCDATPGKCRRLIPIGGACAAPDAGSDINCYPSTQCDGTTKTCALVCK